MPEQRYTVVQDVKEAQAMVECLSPYIYEDQLYRRIGGKGIFSRSNIPYMTLGAVLLRLRRLRALKAHLTDAQQNQLAQLENHHEEVRHEWRVHYERKLVKEALSRLDAMRMFFDECRESPRLCAGAYMPEALRRTIVQEIVLAMAELDIHSADLNAKIALIDGQLRSVVQPVNFIWSEMLQPVYPQESFWWLYHRPSE